MKRVISLLMVAVIMISMAVIPVSATEVETVPLLVEAHWGYYRLWANNRDQLPADWTWRDLEAACGGKPLIAGETIYVPIGKTGGENKGGYAKGPVWVKAGDGYKSLGERLGGDWQEFRRLNNYRPLWANQYMTLKVPNNATNNNESGGKGSQKGKVVGSATLTYKNAPESTMTNVKIAASLLEGMIIKNGKTFDWIRDMLPCRKSLGYVEAPALNCDGSTRGGGICFVSTTLWQAACYYGPLKMIDRNFHSKNQPMQLQEWTRLYTEEMAKH